MKQECDQLKTKTLDQTNKDIMMDNHNSNKELKALKKIIHRYYKVLQDDYTENRRTHLILQNSNSELTKEVERLKIYHDDIVPKNVRGKHCYTPW